MSKKIEALEEVMALCNEMIEKEKISLQEKKHKKGGKENTKKDQTQYHDKLIPISVMRNRRNVIFPVDWLGINYHEYLESGQNLRELKERAQDIMRWNHDILYGDSVEKVRQACDIRGHRKSRDDLTRISEGDTAEDIVGEGTINEYHIVGQYNPTMDKINIMTDGKWGKLKIIQLSKKQAKNLIKFLSKYVDPKTEEKYTVTNEEGVEIPIELLGVSPASWMVMTNHEKRVYCTKCKQWLDEKNGYHFNKIKTAKSLSSVVDILSTRKSPLVPEQEPKKQRRVYPE